MSGTRGSCCRLAILGSSVLVDFIGEDRFGEYDMMIYVLMDSTAWSEHLRAFECDEFIDWLVD